MFISYVVGGYPPDVNIFSLLLEVRSWWSCRMTTDRPSPTMDSCWPQEKLVTHVIYLLNIQSIVTKLLIWLISDSIFFDQNSGLIILMVWGIFMGNASCVFESCFTAPRSWSLLLELRGNVLRLLLLLLPWKSIAYERRWWTISNQDFGCIIGIVFCSWCCG